MAIKKTVLYITPFARPNIGGAEASVDKLMCFAAGNNYYPVLITYQPLTTQALGEKHEVGNSFEIFRVSWFGRGLFNKLENYFPLTFLYLFPGLFIKSLNYYLKNSSKVYCIHAHGLVSGLIAVILSSIKKKRVVVSTHAVYGFRKRKILSFFIRAILSRCDKVLAVSEVARDELVAIGLPQEKVGLHKNWVDTDKWIVKNIAESRKSLGLDKKNNLLFVGRLIEKKGILIFLETAKILQNYGFHVIGTGPMENEVTDASVKISNLKYYGILNQNDPEQFEKLISLYNSCDYLVSSYLYDEGFATVLVESLACGTPVIITNRGSPPTFLDKSVAYFLSENPDAKELARVLEDLCDNDNSMFSREACRKFAVENFGVKNAREVIKTYEPTG